MLVSACGGSEPAPAAPKLEPAVDSGRAEKDARGLITEIYDTVGRGKTDSLFSLLGEPVVVFGPRLEDATASRATALGALGKAVDSRHHPAVRSGALAVVAAPGGHSAWAVDVLSYEGRSVAVTAVLSNTGDLWSLSAAALAVQPPQREITDHNGRGEIVPPGGASAGKTEHRDDALIEKFRRGLLAQDVWGDELAARSDAVVIGPAAGQLARGKAAIKKLWALREEKHIRAATSGEVTTARTADGQLAWLSVAVTRVADDEEPLPLRIFAIYERDGADWKLVALHEALAVGAPGAGAPFKKIAPPPLVKPEVKPEPPAVVEAAVEPPAKAEPAAKKTKAKATTKKKKAKKRARKKPPPPADE